MYRKDTQSVFNTLEDYENFVNRLLEKEKNLKVDPMLDWEDVMEQDNSLAKYTNL